MKFARKICVGVIVFFLSANSFCQSPSSQIAHIKKYKASIDSLHALYRIVHHSLDLDSMRMSEEMGLEERMGESLNLGDNEDGGWEIYVFAKKQGEIYRIYWIGTKKNVWVSKTFYYENGMLVCGEMTVLQQGPHHTGEYTVKEYYWKNKRLAKITRNKFPVIEDRSLIPVSLLKDGKKFYDVNNSKT